MATSLSPQSGTGNTGSTSPTSNSTTLDALVQQTAAQLEVPKAEDDWPTLTAKLCRKKKVEYPFSIGIFNPVCVGHPVFYPWLLFKGQDSALGAIQNHLRCAWASSPFLVEEGCAIVLTMGLIITALKSKTPMELWELVDPLIGILEKKNEWLKTKSAKQSTRDKPAPRLTPQKFSKSPSDKNQGQRKRSRSPK